MTKFIPTTIEEVKAKGWIELDIIIVSGDACIDHPLSGTALIARFLEVKGYKVGIIDQPDWKGNDDFLRLGKPKLFFGVTSGHMDSMLANYTPMKKPRATDKTIIKGAKRPDRCVITYCNKIRELFKDTKIVIGGLEASLRRFSHYDYLDNAVRRSILIDSRADILVYGMGERAILEIARRLQAGNDLEDILGTVIKLKKAPQNTLRLPGFKEIQQNKTAFAESFHLQMWEHDPFVSRSLTEDYGDFVVLQNPPALPLSTKEMDFLYELPFERKPHPKYKTEVKSIEPILFSIITHRGCFGGCSFCSIEVHQGRIIQSRSHESIIREVERFKSHPDFKGIVYDLGGPTANMFAMGCRRFNQGKDSAVTESIVDDSEVIFHYNKNFRCHRFCLPGICPNLEYSHKLLIKLMRQVRAIDGIEKVFVRSGIRYDIISLEYLEELCKYHISGQLKVAPEHTSPKVSALMNKPPIESFEDFKTRYDRINRKIGKRQYLVPYLIVAHPGTTIKEAEELSRYIKNRRIAIEQVQVFTPTPMTLSTCMYYTGINPETKEEVYVPRPYKEKKEQKRLLFGIRKYGDGSFSS